VNAVRLRSLAFNYEPERYTPVVIDTLAGLNRLTMVAPLRLEIETQFLVADELRPAHARLARLLSNQGITVYCQHPAAGKNQRHAGSHSSACLQLPTGRH
jgi:lysine 2,3-aminomutase